MYARLFILHIKAIIMTWQPADALDSVAAPDKPPKKTIPYECIYVNVHPETRSADFLFKDLHYKRCELVFF